MCLDETHFNCQNKYRNIKNYNVRDYYFKITTCHHLISWIEYTITPSYTVMACGFQ